MATSKDFAEMSNVKAAETDNMGSDNTAGATDSNKSTPHSSNFSNFYEFQAAQSQFQYRNAGEYAQALHSWLWQYRMFTAFNVFQSHMISAMTLPQNKQTSTLRGSATGFTPQVSTTPRRQNYGNQVDATNSQGIQYKVPLLWRRVAAEVLDFILLFYAKILVTLAILRQMGYLEEDFIEMESHLPFISEITDLDYDKMFTLTSELIALEVLNRLCITVVETLCLRKGYAGTIGGATPGKKIMRLRVVSFEEVRDLSNGNVMVIGAKNPGFMNALVRSVVKNFSMAFFFPACLTAFFFRFNRCAYDILAHTIVVEVDRGNQQQQQQQQ